MNTKKFVSHLAALALVLLAGCMSPPTGLDLSPQRLTAHNTYIVETHPAAGHAPINKIHTWEVRVTLRSGQPVDGARIAVDGGMPQHGHGLPTQPRVTRALGNGRYLMEGVKFSMTGWWEIKLKIDGAQGSDNVTFNTIVTGKPPLKSSGQDQLARR
jgi:hypothetical protein